MCSGFVVVVRYARRVLGVRFEQRGSNLSVCKNSNTSAANNIPVSWRGYYGPLHYETWYYYYCYIAGKSQYVGNELPGGGRHSAFLFYFVGLLLYLSPVVILYSF